MKNIASKLLSVAPILVLVIIVAYIIEEVLEDFYSEPLSDFVYPITALVVLAIVWFRVVPVLKNYLEAENKQDKAEVGDT